MTTSPEEDAMPKVLVRDLDEATVERLKARARQHGRSLQTEMKTILERAAAQMTAQEFRAAVLLLRRQLGKRRFSDSARLIARDRWR
jgi:plasmid stability protein